MNGGLGFLGSLVLELLYSQIDLSAGELIDRYDTLCTATRYIICKLGLQRLLGTTWCEGMICLTQFNRKKNKNAFYDRRL